MTFEQLGLNAPILNALKELDYHAPSPIQEKAIPPALAGRDVLGCAQTGTGKTCAFAAPILQRLSAETVSGRPSSLPPPGSWPSRSARALRPMASICPCATPSSSAAWARTPRWRPCAGAWTFWWPPPAG